MSSSLMWKPVIDNSKYLGDQLKFILRSKYGEPVKHMFDSSDVPFLEGIVLSAHNGADKEAKKLIELIAKYNEVDVFEQF